MTYLNSSIHHVLAPSDPDLNISTIELDAISRNCHSSRIANFAHDRCKNLHTNDSRIKARRLAYTFCGPAPSLLPMTQLKITDRELILSFKADGPAERELFTSELVERRLRILAEGLSLEGKLA